VMDVLAQRFEDSTSITTPVRVPLPR